MEKLKTYAKYDLRSIFKVYVILLRKRMETLLEWGNVKFHKRLNGTISARVAQPRRNAHLLTKN